MQSDAGTRQGLLGVPPHRHAACRAAAAGCARRRSCAPGALTAGVCRCAAAVGVHALQGGGPAEAHCRRGLGPLCSPLRDQQAVSVGAAHMLLLAAARSSMPNSSHAEMRIGSGRRVRAACMWPYDRCAGLACTSWRECPQLPPPNTTMCAAVGVAGPATSPLTTRATRIEQLAACSVGQAHSAVAAGRCSSRALLPGTPQEPAAARLLQFLIPVTRVGPPPAKSVACLPR